MVLASNRLFFLQVVAMVLLGAQIQRCDLVKCSLISTQSLPPLPHDLAWLYGRVRPLTSTELCGIVGSYIDEIGNWIDSRGRKSFLSTRTRCRVARLSRNQSPEAERALYVPSHRPHCPEAVRLDRRDGGFVRRMIVKSLTKWSSRKRVPMNRMIGRRPSAYVFRTPDEGSYDL